MSLATFFKNAFLCAFWLHDWTDWVAHEPPCANEEVTVHETRQCTRCKQRQHRMDGQVWSL
jgi:hypothetical protein